MILVTLLDIYEKINQCSRKMIAFQVFFALGDASKDNTNDSWVTVVDIRKQLELEEGNLSRALSSMENLGLIERAALDEGRGKKIRLAAECREALGGDHEVYA